MTKKSKTPFCIFTESIGLYFSNISKFIKYMTFPVLGQVGGLVLIFVITYYYSQNLPWLIEKYPILNDYSSLVLISIAVTLPGLIILTKAFWEYLVAYGAVNSMLENMLKSGKVYDFEAHTELIKRRTASFIGLWFLIGVFSIIAVCPLFWIICGILAVYLVLVFQVFTFEPTLSPFGCAKKSFLLIKGHFALTFLLIGLMGILTYVFIPQIFVKIFDILKLNNMFSNMLLPLVSMFPNIDLTMYGLKPITQPDISLSIVKGIVAQVFICYTLPMRSILCGMWYKELNKGLPEIDNKPKRKQKRPSVKLMEASNKKFNKKKIDRNIIRRAMEKDDEE